MSDIHRKFWIFWLAALVVSVSTGQVSADTEASLAMAEDAVLVPDTGTININEADAETTANQLLGIGLRRAQAIVEYRETYGPFYSAEELKVVKGVGSKTVESNRERIRVN